MALLYEWQVAQSLLYLLVAYPVELDLLRIAMWPMEMVLALSSWICEAGTVDLREGRIDACENLRECIRNLLSACGVRAEFEVLARFWEILTVIKVNPDCKDEDVDVVRASLMKTQISGAAPNQEKLPYDALLEQPWIQQFRKENDTAILALGAIIVAYPDPTTEIHVHLVAAKNALIHVHDFLFARMLFERCTTT